MEINKLLLVTTNIISKFDDVSKSLDNIDSESVNNFASDVDDNSKIIKESSQYNLKSITSDNQDEILNNTNGKKTFIVIGNDGCGKCDAVASKISQVAQNLKDEANFVELKYCDNKALFNQLKKDSGYTGSVGFPAIIVCDENGKPEKLLNNVYEEAKDIERLTELYHHEMSGSKKDKEINQKGTTFIYISRHNIPQENAFQKLADNLGTKANFMTLDYNIDNRLIKELATKANGGETTPINCIIKCVDGEPVEIIPQNILTTQKDSTLLNEYFENKISGQENIEKLTTNNADTYLRGTEGTTYIVLGNTNCGYCVKFEPYLNQIIKNIGDEANFLELTYSKNKELYEQLKKETGYEGYVGFPAIIKCVDGKAVEMIDVQNYMAINKNGKYEDIIVDDYTKKLKSKIEGEYKDNPNKKTQKVENEKIENKTQSTTTVETNKKSIVNKQKLENLKENINIYFDQIFQEFTSQQIETVIGNATSISELESIINAYSMLIDFQTQLNLSNTISNFDENADIEKVKEELLKLL